MQLQYMLTVEDFVQYNLYFAKTNPQTQKRIRQNRIVLPLLFAVLFLWLVVLGADTWLKVFYLVITGVVSMVWVVGYPRFYQNAVAKNCRTLAANGGMAHVLGPHTLVLAPEALYVYTPLVETKNDYRVVTQVGQDEGHVYLFISTNQSHIVPNMAFGSPAGREQFLQLLGANMAAAAGRAQGQQQPPVWQGPPTAGGQPPQPPAQWQNPPPQQSCPGAPGQPPTQG